MIKESKSSKASWIFWITMVIIAIYYIWPYMDYTAKALFFISIGVFLISWEYIAGLHRYVEDCEYKHEFVHWYQYSIIWIIYVLIVKFNKWLNKTVDV